MLVVFQIHRRTVSMDAFLQRHRDQIVGVLSGCDRVLFRGTLRSISYLDGMERLLATYRVPLQQFAAFVQRVSGRIKQHAQQLAAKHQRPFIYLESAALSKEDTARQIMERDNIQQGLVCVLSCVEPCQTYALRKDREKKHLLLAPAQRKCLYLYFYFMDREFGLIHVRLQTWLPMSIQVCVNGREYLARRLDRAGIGYEKRDNCFARIDDLPRAQQMMDELDRRKWARFLNKYARQVNPWVARGNELNMFDYYWTTRQSEYATDVMFRDEASLSAVYPALADHAIRHFHSRDVMRFLGRRTNIRFSGPAHSQLGHRCEGMRVKHWVEENSIKMYDKEGTVLRIETTINNPRRLKVRRLATHKGQCRRAWLSMRKGVVDFQRRAEICRAANGRYLEALGVVGEPSPTRQLLDPVSKRITRRGRPYRALRPIDPEEAKLFAVLTEGHFLLQGFRNRDLRERLLPQTPQGLDQARKASGQIGRQLRLLRAHGLIRKVTGTFYYRITKRGHQVMATALKLRESPCLAAAA
jgi:DNA-binding PadR family transcriptional regulator